MSNYIIDYLSSSRDLGMEKEAGFLFRGLRKFLPSYGGRSSTLKLLDVRNKKIPTYGKEAFGDIAESLPYGRRDADRTLRELVDLRRKLRPDDVYKPTWNKNFRSYVQKLQRTPGIYGANLSSERILQDFAKNNPISKSFSSPILSYFNTAMPGFIKKYQNLLEKQKALFAAPGGVASAQNIAYNPVMPRFNLKNGKANYLTFWKGSPRTTSMTENLANALQKDKAYHATLPSLGGTLGASGNFLYPHPNTEKILKELGNL